MIFYTIKLNELSSTTIILNKVHGNQVSLKMIEFCRFQMTFLPHQDL